MPLLREYQKSEPELETLLRKTMLYAFRRFIGYELCVKDDFFQPVPSFIYLRLEERPLAISSRSHAKDVA